MTEIEIEIEERAEAEDGLAPLSALSLPLPPFLSRLEISVVRELAGDEVLSALEFGSDPGPTSITHIRSAHHRLAQLLCEGKAVTSVALLSGYSPGYIRRLQGDPAFGELLRYYSAQHADVFVDTIERIKTLSLTAAEELQTRLEEAPEDWTKRELMELAKLGQTAIQGPGGTGASGGGGGPSVSLNVQFVTATHPADVVPAPIEGKVTIIPPELEI